MSERKGLSKSTRFEIFKRDAFTCQYCGRTPPSVILVVDHILAVANGGSNDFENLLTSCWECNSGKGARELLIVPQTLQQRVEQDFVKSEQYVFGESRISLIRNFLRHLVHAEILEAMDVAHSRFDAFPNNDFKTWRYFCGICWRKIKGDDRHVTK